MGAREDWPVYLGDQAASHYSLLDEINTSNVHQLQVAWTYASGDADPQHRSQIQCNPLIIDGVLYGSSPKLKFFALRAVSGEKMWSFDPFEGAYDQFGMGVNRGLVYWEQGDDQRLLCTAGSFLYALDAKTGKPITSFGQQGKVDLHRGLGREVDDRLVTSNTPGVIYQNLLILGTRVSEESGAAPGHIRAYDVLTGEQAWIFHTIPKPGEYGYDTWPQDAWERVGGANAWSGMTVDNQRGMVFVPTGSASYDFYGGDRHGANLFANCILALNAATGERIWHYQTIHHDLWDRDLPASPNLVTIEQNGQKIDAVAQITKAGYIFVLNRDTGEPLFPVDEVPVPESDLPGEKTYPTQPIPSKPAPFSRQVFTEKDITNISETSAEYVRGILKNTRTGEPFIAPSEQGTIIFPGYDGGGEWGGAGYDPESGWLYVNANEMPWILTMVRLSNSNSDLAYERGKGLYRQFCGGCHGIDRAGGEFMGSIPSLMGVKDKLSESDFRTTLSQGKGVMPAFGWLDDWQVDALEAYLFELEEKKLANMDSKDIDTKYPGGDTIAYTNTGYVRFKDPEGYPAIKPPWGTLSAIDLSQARLVWQVRLGEHEKLTARGIPLTGSENYGGPVVTAGGVVFIAATLDEKLRAFDKSNGKTLWEVKLPAAGYATPSTYMVNGKQYLVIACGGGKLGTKSGDTYVAYSLPD